MSGNDPRLVEGWWKGGLVQLTIHHTAFLQVALQNRWRYSTRCDVTRELAVLMVEVESFFENRLATFSAFNDVDLVVEGCRTEIRYHCIIVVPCW